MIAKHPTAQIGNPSVTAAGRLVTEFAAREVEETLIQQKSLVERETAIVGFQGALFEICRADMSSVRPLLNVASSGSANMR